MIPAAPIRVPADPLPRPQRVNVMQGQTQVTRDDRIELTTVLGSCIACCLFDPLARVGGMNHFLLAEPSGTTSGIDEHYGVYLMEVLINAMLAQGAGRGTLRAHLYGGADMHHGLTRIGSANADFAVQFLRRERIALVRSMVGGASARRVDFRAARGQARCHVIEEPLARFPLTPHRLETRGDVELF